MSKVNVISSPPGYDAVTVEPKAQQESWIFETGDVGMLDELDTKSWFCWGQKPHIV